MNNSFFPNDPLIFAHRGDSGNFPENTMPAFKSAAEMGVDCIETDVHLTIDGKCIVWHDDAVELVPGKKERICSLPWDKLKEFDAGAAFTDKNGSFPFRGKGISLVPLEELLEALPETKFNIDLKDRSKKLVKEFVRIIKDHKALNRILGASFHKENLLNLREALPELPTSFSEDEARKIVVLHKAGLLRFVRNFPAEAFQVPEKSGKIRVVTEGIIKVLHRKGISVHVWTVNEEEEMLRLLKMGVDGIFTDKPRILINTIRGMK